MSGARPSVHNGLVLVDKEVGWTSHDVVAKARGVLGTRKVGHAGTLDPPATGLLLVGVGTMTRLLRYLSVADKTYTGLVVLGTATSTLDDTGEVTATADMAAIGVEEVRVAAATLTGDILQVPPMVSALKVGGRRLHELAREGKEVERDARAVTVHAFDVGEPVAEGVFPVRVRCSSGTYVRSLAADLGAALGGVAHLRDLRRLTTGPFDVADAHRIDEVDPLRDVIPPVRAVRGMATVVVDAATQIEVGHGRPLPGSRLGVATDEAGPWALVSEDDRLLAVYAPFRDDLLKPEVVVADTSV